jgi:hypothetical protein
LNAGFIRNIFDIDWQIVPVKNSIINKTLIDIIVRFVLDLGPRSRINCDILDKVNMLSVTDRVRQLRINHVFNIFHGHAPGYLKYHNLFYF